MLERIQSAFSQLASPALLISIALVVGLMLVFVALRASFGRYIKSIETTSAHALTKTRIARNAYTILRYLLIIFVIGAVLEVNGIDVTALAAAAGVAGIIVGFALQDVLSDLAMGARIVTDNYFHVGQTIKTGEIEGVVESISPQSTRIRDIRTNSIHTVSNRLLTNIEVLGPIVDLIVPLAYGLPSGQAESVLACAAEKIAGFAYVEKCEFRGPQGFGDAGVEYLVRIWCEPSERYQVLRDARRAVQDELEERGVRIPYRQLEVHQSVEGAAGAGDVAGVAVAAVTVGAGAGADAGLVGVGAGADAHR